jgi:hypothetical protein
MRKPSWRARTIAAWACLRGRAVMFNIKFRHLDFHAIDAESGLRLIAVGLPEDSTINGMPWREMPDGDVVLPDVQA